MSRALNVVLEMEAVFPEKYVKPWKTKAEIKAGFFPAQEYLWLWALRMQNLELLRNAMQSSVGSFVSFFKTRICHFFIKAGSKEQAHSSYSMLALIFNFTCTCNWMDVSKKNGISVLF